MAKRFFYACAGILMLALAYHSGATSAGAQTPSNPVVAVADVNAQTVLSANGDVYYSPNPTSGGAYALVNNVFAAPTPAKPTSFGALKARYR